MSVLKVTILGLALLFTLLGLWAQTPEWLWAIGAGGLGSEAGRAIATDSQDNQYVTGSFSGTASFGSFILNSEGMGDVFVGKLDGNGTWLWVVTAGGAGSDSGRDIIVDSSNNIYITGTFSETASFGSTSLTVNGLNDSFVAKMDGSGNWLWARRGGCNRQDSGEGIALDSSANIYLTGWFYDTATFGPISLTSSGDTDIYIAKLDANGNWHWAIRAGGISIDWGDEIVLDSSANIYVTGEYGASAVFGSTTLNCTYEDIFVAKLDNGGGWLWAVNANCGFQGESGGIAVDSSDNVYVTAMFKPTATFGAITLTAGGYDDVFIAKLDGSANWLWAEQAFCGTFGKGRGIALDDSCNVYIVGDFYSSITFGNTTLTNPFGWAIYAAKLGNAGGWLWAKKGGASGVDHCYGLAVDSVGNASLTGSFRGQTAFGAIALESVYIDYDMGYSYDAFVAKISSGYTGSDDPSLPALSCSRLDRAYPNPFRAGEAVKIRSYVSERESGILTIFNLRGEIVASHSLDPGEHQISLDSRGLPSGLYLYRLQTPTVNAVRKLVLLK